MNMREKIAETARLHTTDAYWTPEGLTDAVLDTLMEPDEDIGRAWRSRLQAHGNFRRHRVSGLIRRACRVHLASHGPSSEGRPMKHSLTDLGAKWGALVLFFGFVALAASYIWQAGVWVVKAVGW